MNLFTPTTNPNATRGALEARNPTNAQGGVTIVGFGGGGGSLSASKSSNGSNWWWPSPATGGGGNRGGGGGYGGGGLQDPMQGHMGILAAEDTARANLEVENAERALADGENASRRAAAVLSSSGRRQVGGGAFSSMRRGRGIVLGGAMTGGLAAKNRKVLMDAKSKAISTAADAKAKAYGMGGRDALAKMYKWDKPVVME